MTLIRKEYTFSLPFSSDCLIHIIQTYFGINMPSLFLFLCVLLTLISFIQTGGTRPRNNFECHSFNSSKRIDVVIKTGSKFLAGTDDRIRLLLRDSQGVVCTAADLNNSGDDHERDSIDHYALCCSENFGKKNDSLSLLVLNHNGGHRSATNDWFIESIEVRTKTFLLLKYRFHNWTRPHRAALFGVSKVASSRSNSFKPAYIFIHY